MELGSAAYTLGKVIATEQYGAQTPDKQSHIFETRLDMAYTYDYRLVWWKDEGSCTFTGVVVPWTAPPQSSSAAPSTETVQKVAGYASVIYRKQCPEQEAQQVLRVGEQKARMKTKKNQTVIDYGAPVTGVDLLVEGAQAPEWWPQVVDRLLALAPNNEAAMQWLQQSHGSLLQVMPEYQAQVQALLPGMPAPAVQGRDAQPNMESTTVH